MSDPVAATAPAAVEPAAAPVPASVEPSAPAAPASVEPSAPAAPAAPEADDQANKSIVQKMNDFIKEVSAKNKPKDPTAFAGDKKEPEKPSENQPEKPVEAEDFKSKYDELAPKLAEMEPKLASLTQENGQLKEFQEGVNTLWEDLTKDPVVGKAVAKWLDLRGENKTMPVDENLSKVMESFVSGKKIDWAAVAKGVSNADSAPASVAHAPSAPAPQQGNGLQAAFLASSGRSEL